MNTVQSFRVLALKLSVGVLTLGSASAAPAAGLLNYNESWYVGAAGGIDGVGASAEPHGSPVSHVGRIVDYYNGYTTVQGVTFTSTPAPSVQTLASSWGSYAEPLAHGEIDYQLRLFGPANAWIPVGYEGRFVLTAQGTGTDMTNQSYGYGEAVIFEIGTHDLNPFMRYRCGDGCSLQTVGMSASPTFESTTSAVGWFNGTTGVQTDASGQAVLSVRLFAQSSARWTGGTATARTAAFIDPAFWIAPDWLAAHPETTLTLPDGVGNAVSAVPEPGSWALLAAGMGLLAWRRRREQAHR